MKPKRIALSTIALGNMPGGLERNIAYLANHLVEMGHEVVIVTFDYPDAKAFYDIDKRVTWHRVGRTKPHTAISFRDRMALIGRIRDALFAPRACDAVVCFHHGILLRFLLATFGRRMRIICSERNALTLYKHISTPKWNLNFLLLAFADAITVQFPSYVQDYPRFLRRRIAAVHNPVFPPKAVHGVGREPLLLSIGRYSSQKRFDLLIEACAKVFAEHDTWRLAIIGDGHLKPELQSLIAKLGLAQKVSLVEPQSDLSEWYARATLYCQPSQWEGFPNAQAEAMAAGVIPIGFAATRGVADLVEDGINGYLCKGDETAAALARTISTAIVATGGTNHISASAASITETYSAESWRRAWQDVLTCRDFPVPNEVTPSHAAADSGR